MPHLILFSFLIFVVWLIRRDTQRREGISSAVWIPTLWVGIIASRPVSAWTGMNFGGDTLDGSPMDRAFYLCLIIASILVLTRRAVNWGWLVGRNWPLVIFYLFLLVSVLWANSPFSSFKRWFKEFGNLLVALVILTEANPQQAFRVVFVRCAYVLIPLSLIFVRYFPDLGRRYNQYSGVMEAVGVTFQKNALGTLILACGLIFLWDWIERSNSKQSRDDKISRYFSIALTVIALWLLTLCDSKTSIVTLALSSMVVFSIRMPILRSRINSFGLYTLFGIGAFFVLDRQFGILDDILRLLGRDPTLTGRTEVWRELLKVGTDPLLGTGFMSFWDDQFYQSKLPNWIAFSAHNGYLEIYLAGGIVGTTALAIMIFGVSARINRALADGTSYSVVRFAILVMMLMQNITESSFACMSALGFMFLLAAIGEVSPQRAQTPLIIEGPVPAEVNRSATFAAQE